MLCAGRSSARSRLSYCSLYVCLQVGGEKIHIVLSRALAQSLHVCVPAYARARVFLFVRSYMCLCIPLCVHVCTLYGLCSRSFAMPCTSLGQVALHNRV